MLWTANQLPNENLYTLDDPRAPRFTRFEASIGWLNPSGTEHETKHALLVAGRQEDKRINVLHEEQGSLHRIMNAAVTAKDAFLLRRVWVDGNEPESIAQVRLADGLTGYRSFGKDRDDRTIYQHPAEHWPRFRNRETVCSVVPSPPDVAADLLGGADRIERLTREGLLLVHSTCVQTTWCLDQPLRDVLGHPVMKALILLSWVMEKTKAPTKRTPTPKTRYPNLKKR